MLAFIRQHTNHPSVRPEGFDPDDTASFLRRVDDSRTPVRHLCLRMLGDQAAADRAAAAAVAAAQTHRSEACVREDVRTWLLGYAGQLCLKLLADEPTACSHAVVRPVTDPFGQGVDGQTAQSARLLLSFVDQLAPKDRLIVVLRSWEHFSFEQLAQVLGEPVDVTRRRYQSARERLAERLTEATVRA